MSSLFVLFVLVAACGAEEKTDTGTRPVLAELCDPAACAGDPGPLAPNYICANGAIAGPACVEDGMAACSWQVLDCAEDDACTQDECGPAPGIPNWDCGDGTIAGPACQRINGACAWEIVDCASCETGEPGSDPGPPDSGDEPVDDGVPQDPGGGGGSSDSGSGVVCPVDPTDPGTPGDCTCEDPMPASPNYLCENGQEIAGPACVTNGTGGCGWMFIDCPWDQ